MGNPTKETPEAEAPAKKRTSTRKKKAESVVDETVGFYKAKGVKNIEVKYGQVVTKGQ
nr:hypothetical protein 1 [Deltaproteobacteria bacterium]